MPSMQNVVLTRPRFQWGDKINQLILLVLQVLAVIVMISIPFFMDIWLDGEPQVSDSNRWLRFYIQFSK